MKFIHRLGYYLGGFSIGLVFLTFFLSGKKTACSYGPEARVLKNISTKKHIYTKEIYDFMTTHQIDSLEIAKIIRHGSVQFSESKTQLDSCRIYIIEGQHKENKLSLAVENCNTIARVNTITYKQ
ncbi:MAG: hypothetical protein HRT67_13125 [Flavobacteriaceae bacterium]|nr:hypothetical protein [Flavobacteriaceae bacterium]